MKSFFTILITLVSVTLYSQTLKIERSVPLNNHMPAWANDVTILNAEPIGQMSGVQTSNGTIYLAVNDTTSTSTNGLVIFKSINNGDSWSLFPTGINYRGHFDKLKLVRSGLDSVYCFFQAQGQLYSWNIISNNFGLIIAANTKSFDVTALNNGSLHIMFDTLGKNTIYKWGSINGGTSWIKGTSITSNGAYPKVCSSGIPDTLIVNYYGPVLSDSSRSIIRGYRYRESTTTPGLLQYLSPSLDLVLDTISQKGEYLSSYNNGEAWLLFTSGNPGSRNIYARKGILQATVYGDIVSMTTNPNVDEYWFDIKSNANGFDIIYFSDSVNAGPLNNNNQVLYGKTIAFGSDSAFSTAFRISNNPPFYSVRNYKPQIIQLPFTTSDFGVVWVGETNGQKKLYWDRKLLIVPVELISFTAVHDSKNVTLNWKTATETNNRGFEIERNITGTWEKAGYISGAGNSTQVKYYSFVNSIAGISKAKIQYRIKQIDYSGKFKYTEVIDVDLMTPSKYSLDQNYPNPFNPSTVIKFALPQESNVKLTVYNSIGEKISDLISEVKSAGVYEVNFNGSSLSSGIYFYTLEASSLSDASQYRSTHKMLLIK